MRDEIIKEYHVSVVGGHKGVSKTYWRVRSTYYWKSLKADVQRIVACDVADLQHPKNSNKSLI